MLLKYSRLVWHHLAQTNTNNINKTYKIGIHCIINIIYKRTNYKLHRNLSSWTPKFKLVLQGTFVFWEKGGYCCFDNVLTLCLFAYCVFCFVCPRLVSCVWWCSTHIMLWFLLCLFVLVLCLVYQMLPVSFDCPFFITRPKYVGLDISYSCQCVEFLLKNKLMEWFTCSILVGTHAVKILWEFLIIE